LLFLGQPALFSADSCCPLGFPKELQELQEVQELQNKEPEFGGVRLLVPMSSDKANQSLTPLSHAAVRAVAGIPQLLNSDF
jgi:hypothetical protein